MKKIVILSCFLLITSFLFAQTSDDAFKKPLKEVIAQIEAQFKVKIRYPEDLVKDRMVTYAGWRFRPDLEETLQNVLSSQDITFAKEGEGKYKLQNFQYHLKTPLQGKQQLDFLAAFYDDTKSWEKRKKELKDCMWEALRLSPLPEKPRSKPIISNKRTFNNYFYKRKC